MSICTYFVFCWVLLLALLPVINSQGISLQAILNSLNKEKRTSTTNHGPAAPLYKSNKMSFVIEDTGIPTKRLGSLIVADPNGLKKGPTGSGLPLIPGGNHIKPNPDSGHGGHADSHTGNNGGKLDPNNNGSGGNLNPYPDRGDIGIVTKPSYPTVPVKPLPIQPTSPQILPPSQSWMPNPFMAFIDGVARLRALRTLRCRTVAQIYRVNLPIYAALPCSNVCPRSFRCVSSTTSYSGGVGFCCPFYVSDYAIQLKTMLGRYGVIEEQFF